MMAPIASQEGHKDGLKKGFSLDPFNLDLS